MSDKTLQGQATSHHRILALDVRPHKFGFVVFEGPTQLLDWGVKSYATRENGFEVIVKKRIVRLLDMFVPFVVVLMRPVDSKNRGNGRFRRVLKTIREEVKPRSTSVCVVTRRAMRNFFLGYGCKTKHQIATTLAEWFPELNWKLPLKRKPWQSEDHRMSIFTAAALGVTYFAAKLDRAGLGLVADHKPR